MCTTSTRIAATTLSGDGPAGGHGGGPHARPRGVPRGDARLALPPAHAGPARAPRRRRRGHRRHPPGGRALRRALREPRRAAQPERRAQHRPARGASAADRVRRRRHPGARRLARGPARGRGAIPATPTCSAARSARASRAGRRAPAGARNRRSRRSTSGRRTARPSGSGAPTSRCAARRSSGSASSTSRSSRPHGDEEEWLERLLAAGGRIQYIAAAGPRPPAHRGGRPARAARPGRLCARARRPRERHAPRAGAGRRGRAARARGLRLAHGPARLPAGRDHGRALGGPGRGGAAAAMSVSHPSTFLSGDAGDVTDPWRVAKRRAGEVAYEALDLASGTRRRAARLAANTRPLDVLVLGIYRLGSLMPAALPALRSTRHRVTIALGSLADEPDDGLAGVTVASGLERGKFENLNALLAAQAPEPRPDWTLVVDDDVALPASFLDLFLGVCEAFRARPRPARPDAPQPLGLEGHAAAARGAGERDALRRDRPRHGASGASRRRSCCRSRSCASAGGSTCTGPRSPPSAAGASAWSTPFPCATRRGPSPPATRAARPRRRRRASSSSGPTCRASAPATRSPSTAGRRASRAAAFRLSRHAHRRRRASLGDAGAGAARARRRGRRPLPCGRGAVLRRAAGAGSPGHLDPHARPRRHRAAGGARLPAPRLGRTRW